MRAKPRLRVLLPLVASTALALAPAAADDAPRFCFSPDGGCEALVIAAVDSARATIDAAVYSFTDPGITAALARAVRRGVRVRLVIDERESESKSCEGPYAAAAGAQVKVLAGWGRGGLMHDKFAVIDGARVETGSFNWTQNAERHNAENALLLPDASLAAAYEAEFERLWQGGVHPHAQRRAQVDTARRRR